MPLNRDSSTIADLRPDTGQDFRWNVQRPSSRYQGSHLLNLKRVSRDVVNTRSYVQGDPVRMIDWKAYARTDQLLVREVRDDAAVRVGIAVSLAETMFWPTSEFVEFKPEQRLVSKIEVAMRCALNLAFAHLKLGDFVKIYCGNTGVTNLSHIWAPRSTGEVESFFQSLIPANFSQAAILRAFEPVSFSPQKFEICYAITDGLNSDQFTGFLSCATKSALLHSLSSFEATDAWMNEKWTYFDPQGRGHEYQSEDLCQDHAYLKSLSKWQQRIVEDARRSNSTVFTITEQTRITRFFDQIGAIEERV